MIVKFLHHYKHYKKGTVADVEITTARRLIELDYVEFVPTLQSIPDVKRYDDYENKMVSHYSNKQDVATSPRPRGRPRKKR